MTSIETGILFALNEHKEICGTEKLTELLGTHIGNKHRIFTAALTLQRMGMIEMQISPGGRGHKTVYRDAGVIKAKEVNHV